MADENKPADAGSTTVSSGKATPSTGPKVFTDAKVFHLPTGEGVVSHPCIRFKGDKPKVGDEIRCQLDNGVTYKGTVAEVMDDEFDDKRPVIVQFAGELKPVAK